FRKRRQFTLRQLQPSQLRNLLNFLLRYLHVSLSFPLFKDVQDGLPARPQGVRRLRRTFLTRPPRAAKTALSPVCTSQVHGRPRTPLGAIFNILSYSTVTLLAKFRG